MLMRAAQKEELRVVDQAIEGVEQPRQALLTEDHIAAVEPSPRNSRKICL
jgi:hypothetical protein